MEAGRADEREEAVWEGSAVVVDVTVVVVVVVSVMTPLVTAGFAGLKARHFNDKFRLKHVHRLCGAFESHLLRLSAQPAPQSR